MISQYGIGIKMYPFAKIDVTTGFPHFQIKGQMPVAKDIKIVMLSSFQFLAVAKQELFLLTIKFLFACVIADAAFPAPVLGHSHTKVGVNSRKQPLANGTVEKPL